MSDFLSRLAERQLTDDPGIAPKLPSRFGPEVKEAETVEPQLEARAVRVVDAPRTSQAPRAVAPASMERPPIVHVERPESTHERVVYDRTVQLDRPVVTPRQPQEHPKPEVRPDVRAEGVSRPQTTSQADSQDVGRRDAVEVVEKLTQIVPSEVPRVDKGPGPVQPLVPARTEGPELILQSSIPPPVLRAEAPVVTVTIGRVEVRAVVPPPAQERPKSEGHKALALNDYLERRHGRRR